jgi:choline monooxygenase
MENKLDDFLSPEEQDRVVGKDGLCRRLPRRIYSDAAFHEFEYQGWLDRTWLVVGRAHEISNPGDVIPVPGHPIFLARDQEGIVRAFYNACRHRGHELVAERCNVGAAILCPYHHWAYELNGRLRTATHFSGVGEHGHPALDPDQFGLRTIRTGQWHNWILINVDGKAAPLEDFVAPLAELYQDVEFAQARHFATVQRHPLGVNWKTAMENNIEPYHVPMVHPGTAGGHPFDNHRIINDGPLVGCAVDIEGSRFTNLPEQKDNRHLDSSGRFVLRVPNLYIAAHAPDKLVDSIILPDRLDPGKCWISHACYSTAGMPVQDAEADLWRDIQQQVLDEDVAVLEGVARGFRAPVMDDGGVISPAWESCVSGFYREMLDAMRDIT